MRTVKRSLPVYSVQMVQLVTARNAEVKHGRMAKMPHLNRPLTSRDAQSASPSWRQIINREFTKPRRQRQRLRH